MGSALTMPSGGIVDIKWMPQTAVAKTESPFSFASQVHKHPGQRRQVKVRLAPMEASTAREWIAFFLKLNGPEGVFFLSDTVGQNPTASRGTPLVSGASQTGKSIAYSGGALSSTIVTAGEWLSIGNRLHQATDDSTSDAYGNGTFKVWPEVQIAPPNAAPIEVDSPKGTFRLIELPSYTWSVNRLMQGVSFTAAEVLAQEILDFVGVTPVFACSNTRNLFGGWSGPRFDSTAKIFDQGPNGNDAFPNASGAAVTLNADNSWSFATSGTKSMLNFGPDGVGIAAQDQGDGLSFYCVIDTSSNNQMILSRGSTGNDWMGRWRTPSHSTSASESGVTIGDYRKNGAVVSPKNSGGLRAAFNGQGKLVLSIENIAMSEMSGTLAFGVQNATFGFKGKLYEAILLPDLSSDLRDALIDNMKAAHGIS